MFSPLATTDYFFLLVEPFWHISGAILFSVLPAWGAVNRLNLDPSTKLVIAVIGSYTLMYLLEFSAYLLSVPQWIPLSLLFVISAASAVYTTHQGRKNPTMALFPWDGVIIWWGLAVWIMGMQSRVVVYGGASWFGDWFEHYERAILFLDQLPSSTKFLYKWTLPARGPTFNASIALLMSIFGRDFWVYQTLATVLNTFAVLPMALLIRDMSKMSQLSALVWSFVIFGIAPFAVQQETFTWTKFFTVGFILGGIHLYRLGCTQSRPWVVGWSFGAFTAGILAHYMALIFALFFAAHFLYSALRKRWKWKVVFFPAIACSALLATWLTYLILTFGLQTTLRANSTLGEEYAKTLAGLEGQSAAWHSIFMANLVTTILPYSWRHDIAGMGRAPHVFQADPRAGRQFTPSIAELNRTTEWFVDLANNPNSLLGALGWAGGVGLLITSVLFIRKKPNRPSTEEAKISSPAGEKEPGWIFWLIFFVVGIPLNVLLNTTYVPHGTAHINLQPYICLIAVLLLRGLQDLRLLLKVLLFGLYLTESALTTGALLTLQERPVPLVLQPDGKFLVLEKVNLDPNYVNNYVLKLLGKSLFLSDRQGDLSRPFSLISAVVPLAALIAALGRLSKNQKKQGNGGAN